MPAHISPSDHVRQTRRRKRRAIASGEPCPSNHVQVRPNDKAALQLAAKMIGALWLVATPRPKEFSLNSFRWELIAQLKYDDVAQELTLIGLLERVQGGAGTTEISWAHRFRLASVEQPLDQRHSAPVRRIIDCMLQYWESDLVCDLRAVPGLMSKLLGDTSHRRPGCETDSPAAD